MDSDHNKDDDPYEADSCFETVVEGYKEHDLSIKKVKSLGFLGDAKKRFLAKTINVPPKTGTYAAWHDAENEAAS